MIRRATEADVPFIVDLCLEAHRGSVWEDVVPADPESCAAACRAMMQTDDMAVFVCDRGTLWLARFPLWMNRSQSIVNEVFFYATRGGDALRREGQRWAKGSLMTLSRHDRTTPRLDAYYRRLGFAPLEHTFIRRA